MKKIFAVFIGLVMITGVAACTPQVAASPAATEVPAATSMPAETAASETAAAEAPAADVVIATEQPAAQATLDVEALILEKLQGHHGIDRVLRANFTREKWNATLDRMIGYGAKISEEEKQAIIDYLISR